MAIIKVVLIPKRSAPIDQAVYYVETHNYNIAEYKAALKRKEARLWSFD